MSNIEQILSRCDLRKEDDESLASIRMHSEGAYEGIMSGLGAIDNAVFWACDNKNYTDDMARDDLYRLGEMLMYLPGIASALKFNADEADFNISEHRRISGK
ncbi:hypothetical protein EG393_03935 [Salmonella enterica]|nr:hypothetical protein [Salmonella enterica]EBP9908646.1 hypothetical protein [Salmonella enterica subsp. enterica]EDR6324909.1 hypothetical protein [Salmonella enterica subsp. enterica serovar Tucson]EDV3151694.1 hypothetical protein [Salmonella enterica subsp. enterica serovar Chandans]EEC0894577.1 hypothetical protein [Salmonella enterica subsp. enterica serovar Koumra]